MVRELRWESGPGPWLGPVVGVRSRAHRPARRSPRKGGRGIMIRPKDGVRPIWAWIAPGLVLGLSGAELGCTAASGLRSVGPARPPLLGLWGHSRSRPAALDRGGVDSARTGPATPDPAETIAVRPDGAGARAVPGHPSARSPTGAEGVASSTHTGAVGRPTSPAGTARDETIRVTLGRPEPLPALTTPEAAGAAVATTGSTSRGRGDRALGKSSRAPAPPPEPEPHAHRVADRAIAAHSQTRPAQPAISDAAALLARAESKLRSLHTYQVRISRVERVGGRLQPE